MKNKEYNLGVLQDLKSAICFNLVNDPMEKEIEQALDMVIKALEQEAVLDKIIAEIMKLQTYKMFEGDSDIYVERDDVLEIINKYKPESEEVE